MFEQASRLKLRFDTPQGFLSIEDLWDLPLSSTKPGRANLDDIAIALHNKTKNESISFVNATKPDPGATLALDVVKRVIEVKMEENRVAAEARDRAVRKQKLLEVLARKEDASLEQSSEEDIRKMIDALA